MNKFFVALTILCSATSLSAFGFECELESESEVVLEDIIDFTCGHDAVCCASMENPANHSVPGCFGATWAFAANITSRLLAKLGNDYGVELMDIVLPKEHGIILSSYTDEAKRNMYLPMPDLAQKIYSVACP